MEQRLRAALDLCETWRAELFALLDSTAPDQWQARVRPNAWTVAEHFDHLVKSEIGTSKIVRRLIRGDYAQLTRPVETPVHDSRLTVYPYGRLEAPAALVPTALRREEAREQLLATHARFSEELGRFEGRDSDALAAPDPATDVWFTLAGWVRLQALHEAHHIAQIRALLLDKPARAGM